MRRTTVSTAAVFSAAFTFGGGVVFSPTAVTEFHHSVSTLDTCVSINVTPLTLSAIDELMDKGWTARTEDKVEALYSPNCNPEG